MPSEVMQQVLRKVKSERKILSNIQLLADNPLLNPIWKAQSRSKTITNGIFTILFLKETARKLTGCLKNEFQNFKVNNDRENMKERIYEEILQRN